MARTLPSTLIAGMFAPQADVLVLALIEIAHPAVTTVRIVNNTEAVTSQGDAFDPFPFSVVLPPEGDGAVPAIRVTISNVTPEITALARSVAGSTAGLATASLHIIDHADPDARLVSYEGFAVRNLTYTAEAVAFDMTIESFVSEPYPAMTFTPGRFPGLF